MEEIVVKSLKERKRWGLPEVSLDDVKQNVAPIPKADLQKLIENSALGSEAHLSVMDTNITYGENYHKQLYNVFCTHLICDCQSFTEYSKIDSNGYPLDNQNPTEKYRIVFTPQERNLTDDSLPDKAKELVGINAYDQRKKMAKGVKFVTPDVWISMFQRGLDEILVKYYNDIKNIDAVYNLSEADYRSKIKQFVEGTSDEEHEKTKNELIKKYLPDIKTATTFPDLVCEDGDIARLDFNSDNLQVFLICYYPDNAAPLLGSRLALG